MTQTLTIATRQSPLALWQANFVKNQLQKHHPNLKIRLLELVTRGDKILDTPLAKIGGKGLFVKELEQALLEGRADIAVHSLKDVPMVLPEGLILSTYCQRHTPTDAFVSRYFTKLEDLPEGASVGTSSLRRECQLRAYRPDLQIKSLRGNVGTRLAKLDEGKYDAIVLATSGLERLGLQARIRHQLSTDISLPAVGQGILAIESRQDTDLLARMAVLDDTKTRLCAIAERAMNRTLEGGCQVPIAGFATLEQDTLHLSGRVGQVNGQKLLQAKQSLQLTGTLSDQQQQAEQLGMAVAQNLLEQGAYAILSLLYSK